MTAGTIKAVRIALVLAGFGAILLVGNATIFAKQEILREGRLILLELRPRDPRSLIQGDYMVLRYGPQAFPPLADTLPPHGRVILKLDADGVATFARLDDGAPLGAHEVRLRYKSRLGGRRLRYGAESFFFQEGDARLYADARYGALRVDPAGKSVLVGLADEDRQLIRRP